MQARILLGMSYYGSSQFAEAVPPLQSAVDADPSNQQLRFVLAQSALAAKQYDTALKQFEWLARERPDSAATHLLTAEALDGLGRTDEAIAEMQAAVKASPGEPNARFGLGYLLWKARRYDEAETEFRAELAHDSSHAKAAAWLGDVLLKRGDAAAAQPLLEKALALSPQLRLPHLDLGILYADRKDYDRAVKELREAVRLDPSRTDARSRLVRIYKETGREREAQSELAAIERLSSQDLEAPLDKLQDRPPDAR